MEWSHFETERTRPDESVEAEELETDSDGYFASVRWKTDYGLELRGKVDVNSIDDPFALSSPTDRARYRVQARYRWETGLFLSGSYQLREFENDDSGWDAETTKAVARLGYRQGDLDVSFGYSLYEAERSIQQLVTSTGPRTDLFDIFYESDADFLDGRIRWKAHERVTLGGMFRTYENSGSFALEHQDFRGFVEVGFLEDYVTGLAYRTVDYDEASFDVDDYDADIVELSIGYRW
ncbi:MAG: hypothetical protein R3234_06665 [Thermoanaerobaculia bacterium]|nr:hypothetical protein [Thermoanaerobaculia bacterium]